MCCLREVDGMPVVASSEVVTCGIEGRTLVNGLPEVGSSVVVPVELVVAALFSALAAFFLRLACTIVEGMILQHHVGNLYLSTGLTAAEVEYQVHLGNILTFHIALHEQIFCLCLQRNDLVEVEIRIVSSVSEFHSGAVQILISLQFDGEVVVLASLSGNASEVLQLELCLPALVRLVRQRHHKLLVALVGVSDIIGVVAFPAVAVGIVAGEFPGGIAQHIAVAVELIALEGLGSVVFLAGEHEAPGDAFALIEQYHLRIGKFGDSEDGISILCVAGDIGEECLIIKNQHNLVTIDIKAVTCRLSLNGSHKVGLAAVWIGHGVVVWPEA